jgi:FdhE protein
LNSVPKLASEDSGRRWTDRIQRACELEQSYPEAAVLLHFYGNVLTFQRGIARASRCQVNPRLPLREQIDFDGALEALPELLTLALQCGPELLAAKAETLRQMDRDDRYELFRSALFPSDSLNDEGGTFFARTCLQPIAENLQMQLPGEANYFKSSCPACGGYPQLAILRSEGDGGRRSLLCSFCLHEWVFRRIVCPCCGEEDKEKLPYYSTETCKHVRVQGCDTCHRYLKVVDMTVDGHAVPLVDEAALAVLDVWANDHGYAKITRNLIGL